MGTAVAPALTGDWLNGWLAAVGVTVLLPDVTLAWTTDGVPKAVFGSAEELPAALAAAIPSEGELDALLIAKTHVEAALPMLRNVPRKAYRERAALARRRSGDGSLAASVTDLKWPADDVEHSPLDPPAPRGETLHDRLVRCRAALGPADGLPNRVDDGLAGRARRVRGNGLGFDYRRISAVSDSVELRMDPLVELLAFFGLWLIPARGDGTRSTVRGWTRTRARGRSFSWPLWTPQLDRWGIDAVLDRWHDDGHKARVFGIVCAYRTVSYQAKAQSDVTRAYASERCE